MPVLSPKRQITLPKEMCNRLMIKPGDEFSILEHVGRLTLLKKVSGASDGLLKHINVNNTITNEKSLEAGESQKHS